MATPLSANEISSLSRGLGSSPWLLVTVDVFERRDSADELGLDEVAARVLDRLPFVPRFRQRIRDAITGLDWVDDPDFDVNRHLSEITLEAPGRLDQVTDLVAEGLTQRLDPAHPLWAITVVKGLRGGQVALVTRVHPAYVDGVDNVHLLQELYDDQPVAEVPQPSAWVPQPEPTPADDVVAGVVTGIRDPFAMVGRITARAARTVGQGVEWVQNQGIPIVLRGQPVPPATRYCGGGLVSLAAVNRVRDRAGCTTHDVLIAMATAGLRQWQTQAGSEPTDLVALVPLAVHDDPKMPSAVGARIAGQYETLPVASSSPQGRLDQVVSLTQSRIDSGQTVSGAHLTRIAGFGPPTLHAMAARTVVSGRDHDLLCSNAPGPRGARYFGQWQLHSSYPVLGLADSEDATVGFTSYQGTVAIAAVGTTEVSVLIDGMLAELDRLDPGERGNR